MAYKYDSDLEFLKECSDANLDILVDVLIKDTDGELRFSEELTINDLYKVYYPKHSKYWHLIASEIQTFGGNTFMNIFRGGGVQYKEVLCDVADKMKVNYNKNSNVEKIELNLLMKVLEDSIEKMTPEELKEIVKDLNLKTTNFTSQAVLMAMQTAIRSSGFMAYQVAVIVANAVAKQVLGRGLMFATNAGLTKAISVFAGPIGWVITGLWTMIDIAGPAYRVTIPTVIQIAFLRQQNIKDKKDKKTKEQGIKRILYGSTV